MFGNMVEKEGNAMVSYEEMRKNGFIDVYGYGDKDIIKVYCDKHRYIPHYVEDFDFLK